MADLKLTCLFYFLYTKHYGMSLQREVMLVGNNMKTNFHYYGMSDTVLEKSRTQGGISVLQKTLDLLIAFFETVKT